MTLSNVYGRIYGTDFVSKGLLRYCELDTFAMVVIYEFWKNEIDNYSN